MRPTLRRPPRGRLLSSAVLALLVAHAVPAPCQAFGQGPAQPPMLYWYRNPQPEYELGPMGADARLMANAFGLRRYRECRLLAESALGTGADARALGQAASYLVLSYLAEADFAGARAAARRTSPGLPAQEQAGWIADAEGACVASVRKLQDTAASAQEAARLHGQLLLGHLYQQAGLLRSAEAVYWSIAYNPTADGYALLALAHIIGLRQANGDTGGALAACAQAVGRDPDSDLAARACEAVLTMSLALPIPLREPSRRFLAGVAANHPRTLAADAARLGLAALLVAEGDLLPAEGQLTSLLEERPGSGLAPRVRASLTEIRYTAGIEAMDRGDLPLAGRLLGQVLQDLDSPGLLLGQPWGEDGGDATAGKRRTAVRCLGRTYQLLAQWDAASAAFKRLAELSQDDAETEEMALFEAGRSEYEAGRPAEAVEAFRTLMRRRPGSAFAPMCEDCLRALDPAAGPRPQ